MLGTYFMNESCDLGPAGLGTHPEKGEYEK